MSLNNAVYQKSEPSEISKIWDRAGVPLQKIDELAPPKAVIFGIAGAVLTDEEKALFKESQPLGFILFARNCIDRDQLRALTNELRNVMGRSVPILIDQEGGRVARMRAPNWPKFPAAEIYGDLYQDNAMDGLLACQHDTTSIATILNDAGINVNCAPVLDVRMQETHDAIGDRAYSRDPDIVGILGQCVNKAYLAQNIMPIVKHIPGQGRATLDSHKDLPHVGAGVDAMINTDFEPYLRLAREDFAHSIWGMVSHIVYDACDSEHPASCSKIVISNIIRKELKFDGLLLTDDLSMDALSRYGDEAARALFALQAGCDIALHCNGKIDQMADLAKSIPVMTEQAVARYNRSVDWMMNFKMSVV